MATEPLLAPPPSAVPPLTGAPGLIARPWQAWFERVRELIGNSTGGSFQLRSEKGAASGYASLDASTHVVEDPAVFSTTPPAGPAAQRLYKHPTAGAKGFAVPMAPGNAFGEIVPVLTAAQGGIAAGALESWHEVGAASEPAFANSWVNFSGSTPAAFRKLADGMVVLKGLVKNGTVTTTIFILPAGYRPVQNMRFATISNGTYGQILVTSAGAVTQEVGGNTNFGLEISFFVGA